VLTASGILILMDRSVSAVRRSVARDLGNLRRVPER
jgi:hypothetical protein